MSECIKKEKYAFENEYDRETRLHQDLGLWIVNYP